MVRSCKRNEKDKNAITIIRENIILMRKKKEPEKECYRTRSMIWEEWG
jgi:hypothetical protein